MRAPHAVEAYLRATSFCDAEHPEVRARALEYTRGVSGARLRACALFERVRDDLRYRFGDWNRCASAVLRDGVGSCSSKANVLVALARSLEIPAGFHVMRVRSAKIYGPAVVPFVHRNFSPRSVHVYAAVYLGGRWLRCDPSDDAPLVAAVGHICEPCVFVRFDGHSDALLNFRARHIYTDEGPLPSIDHLLRKPPRRSRATMEILGLYIDFLRERGRSYTTDDYARIELDYIAWLETRQPELIARFRGEQGSASRVAA